MSNIRRRRRFFLPKTSQLGLLLWAQAVLVITLVVSGFFFYDYMYADLEDGYLSAHQKIGDTMDLLLPGLFLMCVAALFLAVIANVFYTHRIVGPVFRLCRILREIGDGNLDQFIKFRDHDALRELEASANEMAEKLSRKLENIRSGVSEISRELDGLNGSASPGIDTETIAHLRERVMEVKTEIETLRLREPTQRA